MHLSKDLRVDHVAYGLKSNNKREAMKDIAVEICRHFPALDETALFDLLLDQERLAGSGIGNGIAIPHIKTSKVKMPISFIAKLHRPVEFDSFDNQPVNFLWVLISPRQDGPLHLMRLAKTSRLLNRPELGYALTQAQSEDEIQSILLNTYSEFDAAA